MRFKFLKHKPQIKIITKEIKLKKTGMRCIIIGHQLHYESRTIFFMTMIHGPF